MKLEGKVAVVTGAGSGIGRAIAVKYAAEGASVVVTDLVKEKVEETAHLLEKAGAKVIAVAGDVSSDADVGRMIDAARSSWGTVDVLCNNAGVMDRLFPLHEVTDELWNKILGVNLGGAFYTCRRVLPLMLEKKSGTIVNIASVAGLHGGRGGAAYTASKHALIGLTKSIAWFYGPQGIRANALCPGAIETPLGTSGQPSMAGIKRMQPYFTALPRSGQPEEIASVAAFLASSESAYVNGDALVVDGGWSTF